VTTEEIKITVAGLLAQGLVRLYQNDGEYTAVPVAWQVQARTTHRVTPVAWAPAWAVYVMRVLFVTGDGAWASSEGTNVRRALEHVAATDPTWCAAVQALVRMEERGTEHVHRTVLAAWMARWGASPTRVRAGQWP